MSGEEIRSRECWQWVLGWLCDRRGLQLAKLALVLCELAAKLANASFQTLILFFELPAPRFDLDLALVEFVFQTTESCRSCVQLAALMGKAQRGSIVLAMPVSTSLAKLILAILDLAPP